MQVRKSAHLAARGGRPRCDYLGRRPCSRLALIALLARRIKLQNILRCASVAAVRVPLTRLLRVPGGGPFGRPVRRLGMADLADQDLALSARTSRHREVASAAPALDHFGQFDGAAA
jgi:hypothetical protein